MPYPDELDTFPTAADLANDTLATKPHSTLHGALGVAVRALEEIVGVNGAGTFHEPFVVQDADDDQVLIQDAGVLAGGTDDTHKRWQLASDGTGLTLYDADGSAVSYIPGGFDGANGQILCINAPMTMRVTGDVSNWGVTTQATIEASPNPVLGASLQWADDDGTNQAGVTINASGIGFYGSAAANKLGFFGAAGLDGASRPAIPTQVVAVDVTDFNALRTALIAVGLITDGD